MIRPLNDTVAIKRLDADEMTLGGLYLPDTAKERPQKGLVVAVGPGANIEGTALARRKPSVEVGDTVVFSKYQGSEITLDGHKVLLISESEILAIVEE